MSTLLSCKTLANNLSLNSDISSLQTRLTTTKTYVSNMSHTQATLINHMAAKLEVIPKEEDRIKSLPTHHTVATIQVVEDLKTVSTHHTPSPPGPINGDATTSTIDEETSMNIEAFKQVSLNDITTFMNIEALCDVGASTFWSNFDNNNAYRSNFGNNNPRPFPSNNYGNNNTYPSTRNSTSELETLLKDFITTQKSFNKSVKEKLHKLDILSLKVDNIAHDVEMLKIRTSPPRRGRPPL